MSTENGAQARKADDPRRRVPAILAAVAVIALGLAYYAGVKRNTAYLVGRDMRLLSDAGKQLNQSLTALRMLVKNFAFADMWSEEKDKAKPLLHYERTAMGRSPIGKYFGDLDAADRAPQTGTPPLNDEYTQTLTQKNDQLIVELTYRAAKKTVMPRGNELAMKGKGLPIATGRLSLDKVVERVFTSTLMASFDSVLLASGDGTVVYQVQPAAATRRAALTHSADSSPAIVLTSLASLREEGTFRGEMPISVELLRTQSRQTDVAIAGAPYVLISQPFSFDSLQAAQGPKEKSGSWILCGLVAKSRFRHEATALNASTLAIGTAVFLFLLCCGPFLKLALLGAQQPVKRADVILLTVSTLVGASIAAIFVADVLAYRRLDAIAGDEEQLAFAADLSKGLSADINQGLKVADELMNVTGGIGHKPLQGSLDGAGARLGDRLPESSRYPWATSFAWIERNGSQFSRGEMGDGRPPMLKVRSREYFKRVQNDPLMWHGAAGGAGRPMFIESVRALTTGQPETVFAVPTHNPDLPVFSVTMPFIRFESPVAPPAMTFAVIDDEGNVLYHEDQQRIRIENVFAETDNDRTLRAVVFSRREEWVDAPYWGRDQRILVTPLRDLHWTLLTFRDRSLLRATNLDTLVVTAVLLALYFGILAVIFVSLNLLCPGYRARWLWPGEHRAEAWRRLAWLLGLSAVSFAVALFYFAPTGRLAVSLLFPIQAALAAYLILEEPPKRPAHALVLASWAAITLFLLYRLLAGPLEAELVFAGTAWLIRAVMFGCAAAGVALTLLPRSAISHVSWRSYARRYIMSGVLAVIVLAVLPAVGFFQTAFGIEVESLVKYGQLVIADELQQRLETVTGRSWRKALTAAEVMPPPNFRSRWSIDALASSWPVASNEVAELLEPLLPQYSDESTAMRDLHHGEASDGRWAWKRNGRIIELARPLAISEGAKKKLGLTAEPRLAITSRTPWVIPSALLPAAPASAADEAPVPIGAVLLVLFLVVILIGVLRVAIRFFARRVFLYDLAGAPRRLSQWPVRPLVGEHLYVVHAQKRIEELVDMTGVKEIALAQPGDWAAEAADNRRLLIQFGDWRDRAEAMARKLQFLEDLLRVPDRNVIVASNMAPLVVLSRAGEDAGRWSGLLTSFVYLDERRLHRGAHAKAGCASFVSRFAQALGLRAAGTKNEVWLAEEAEGYPFLDEVREQLKHEDSGREQLIDEFCERAGPYYARLWSQCSPKEHHLLDQLARYGYVNSENRPSLRRLLNVGLVLRDPAIRLFNESFRRFVLNRPPAEVQTPEAEKVDSAWDRLRVPLFVMVIAVAAFFLSTQKELMNATSAIITGLTAGLPALMKLGSVLSSKRSAPAAAE
ncbi:MAG TPA: hypothetical protein VJ276_23555 [Thermoanaerobaculia bacterium]|nr:hypothetical protein [Thermoanaerobaculia bacterium]